MTNTKPIQIVTLNWHNVQPPVYHYNAGQTDIEAGSVKEICIQTSAGNVRIDCRGNITVHSTHGLPSVTTIAENALKVQI